jgi:hypothetical protein
VSSGLDESVADVMTAHPVRTAQAEALLRRGRVLEGVTLGWNVAGIAVLAVAVVAARSVLPGAEDADVGGVRDADVVTRKGPAAGVAAGRWW